MLKQIRRHALMGIVKESPNACLGKCYLVYFYNFKHL